MLGSFSTSSLPPATGIRSQLSLHLSRPDFHRPPIISTRRHSVFVSGATSKHPLLSPSTSKPAASLHGWSSLLIERQINILSRVLTATAPLDHTIFEQPDEFDDEDDDDSLDGMEKAEQLSACIRTRNRNLADLIQSVYYSANIFCMSTTYTTNSQPEDILFELTRTRARLFRPSLARMQDICHLQV